MSRRFHRSIAVFSIIALLVAFGISVAGALVQNSTNRYQPAAELKANEIVLDDKAFSVDGANAGRPHLYPRLRISAVDDAFANTRVSLLNDADLVDNLREWRDKVSDFNRRLDITELRGFTVADVTERGDMHRRLVQQSGWLAELRADLVELQQHLCDRHERYLPKQHDHVVTVSATADINPAAAAPAAADTGA